MAGFGVTYMRVKQLLRYFRVLFAIEQQRL